jgi:hypothetical protein
MRVAQKVLPKPIPFSRLAEKVTASLAITYIVQGGQTETAQYLLDYVFTEVQRVLYSAELLRSFSFENREEADKLWVDKNALTEYDIFCVRHLLRAQIVSEETIFSAVVSSTGNSEESVGSGDIDFIRVAFERLQSHFFFEMLEPSRFYLDERKKLLRQLDDKSDEDALLRAEEKALYNSYEKYAKVVKRINRERFAYEQVLPMSFRLIMLFDYNAVFFNFRGAYFASLRPFLVFDESKMPSPSVELMKQAPSARVWQMSVLRAMALNLSERSPEQWAAQEFFLPLFKNGSVIRTHALRIFELMFSMLIENESLLTTERDYILLRSGYIFASQVYEAIQKKPDDRAKKESMYSIIVKQHTNVLFENLVKDYDYPPPPPQGSAKRARPVYEELESIQQREKKPKSTAQPPEEMSVDEEDDADNPNQ